jgi:hypothetical protein
MRHFPNTIRVESDEGIIRQVKSETNLTPNTKMSQLDYYKILRLKSSATPKEIESSYKDLFVLYDNKNQNAAEIMELVDAAYLVLRDPGTRANYNLARAVAMPESPSAAELSEAENIINSWGEGFTPDERRYLDKVHSFNQVVRAIIFVIALIFLWSVVSFRWDISSLLIFTGLFLRVMLGSIYRIQNPPPPPEVWAIK